MTNRTEARMAIQGMIGTGFRFRVLGDPESSGNKTEYVIGLPMIGAGHGLGSMHCSMMDVQRVPTAFGGELRRRLNSINGVEAGFVPDHRPTEIIVIIDADSQLPPLTEGSDLMQGLPSPVCEVLERVIAQHAAAP